VPDRHPDHRLLVKLESIAAQLLNRHLAMAKEWLPHEYVAWRLGRDFDTEPWAPDQPRLTGVAQAALEVNLLTEDNLPSYHHQLLATSATTGPGTAGRTAGPPRRAATRSCSATIYWSPATSTRSPWSAAGWPPCSKAGRPRRRRWR
jgi:Fatty acid desaturase